MLADNHNFHVAPDPAEISAETCEDIINFPAEPIPTFATKEQLDAGLRTARWILDPIGRDGIVVKILAVRCLLRWESDSMSKVAKKYGVTRQALSKQANALADALQIPRLRSATSRDNNRRAALRAWQKRKAKQ